MKNKLSGILNMMREIRQLPKLDVTLGRDEHGNRLWKSFTSRHPRYLIIQRKSVGVAMIDLREFANADAYTQSVNGKNSAAYFARRARREGYSFEAFDITQKQADIYSVNTSAQERQGREMDASYRDKNFKYPATAGNEYYGVFKNGELCAYLWVVRTGQIVLLNRLLGHADHLKNGVMYLLVTAFAETELARNPHASFVMYDTFFGASEGLQLFKTRCGFRSYRIKWNQE